MPDGQQPFDGDGLIPNKEVPYVRKNSVFQEEIRAGGCEED
jgi:hypothetical protein